MPLTERFHLALLDFDRLLRDADFVFRFIERIGPLRLIGILTARDVGLDPGAQCADQLTAVMPFAAQLDDGRLRDMLDAERALQITRIHGDRRGDLQLSCNRLHEIGAAHCLRLVERELHLCRIVQSARRLDCQATVRPINGRTRVVVDQSAAGDGPQDTDEYQQPRY